MKFVHFRHCVPANRNSTEFEIKRMNCSVIDSELSFYSCRVLSGLCLNMAVEESHEPGRTFMKNYDNLMEFFIATLF